MTTWYRECDDPLGIICEEDEEATAPVHDDDVAQDDGAGGGGGGGGILMAASTRKSGDEYKKLPLGDHDDEESSAFISLKERKAEERVDERETKPNTDNDAGKRVSNAEDKNGDGKEGEENDGDGPTVQTTGKETISEMEETTTVSNGDYTGAK